MKASAQMLQLLKRSGSNSRAESVPAMQELAQALALPLREAVFSGNNLDGIFSPIPVNDNQTTAEFPLDIIAPGTEKDYVAFTVPKAGALPSRNVEGDFVNVPIYEIGNAISWLKRHARQSRWDIVARSMQVFESGFTKKLNDDGWHTLLAAAVDRNVLVFDGDAAAGQFTKRLVSLAKVIMRRNGGGNSTSMNRSKLTDLYLSPECMEDIRSWGVDQVDEFTRREIYVAADGAVNRVFSVNLHDMDELGEEQEYQNFFSSVLAGTLASGDVELMIGLDLSTDTSFVQPQGDGLEVFPDETQRARRDGVWGTMSTGFGVLDQRKVIALSA